MDLDKTEIRVFKVSRISSDITFTSKSNAFSIPKDFSIKDHLIMLSPEPKTEFIARVRVGRCNSLRSRASITNIDGEWDRITFQLGSDWLERVLWFGEDLIIESPADKVAEFIKTLRGKL